MYSTPQLVTLEGDYDEPVRKRRSIHRQSPYKRRLVLNQARRRRDFWKAHGQNPETMGGILDWGKSVVTSSLSPITSSIKAVGHTIGEASRGASSGDWLRVIASPVKGSAHGIASMTRDTQEHAEWYYRPSKMRQWMKPVGAMVSAAGVVPTPASPFLLAGGAALSAGGAIGDKLYQKDKAQKAVKAGETQTAIEAAQKSKQNNLYLYGALGVGALAVLMLAT